MIRFAKKTDLSALQSFWKECCQETRWLHNFDEKRFAESLVLLSEEEENISASVIAQIKTYSFADKLCKTGVIQCLCCQEGYEAQLQNCLKLTVELLARNCLFTLWEHPDLAGEMFCFAPAYRRKRYEIKRGEFPLTTWQGLSERFQAQEIWRLYQKYTKHFSGYPQRTLQDIENYTECLLARGGHILCLTRKEECVAYASFFADSECMHVEEILFCDYQALCQLLTGLLSYSANVVFYVPAAFSLRRYSSAFHEQEEVYVALRVNHWSLLSDWAGRKITTMHDFYKYCQKPFMTGEML